MKTEATSDAIENREQPLDIGEILANGGPKPIEVAPADAMKADRLEMERFMSEILEVHLHEPAHEEETSHCYVGVNGDSMWLARGGTYQLKRYHVAALATAKTGRVNQRKLIAPDGSQSYVETEVLSIAYPFTVIHDPNPRGPTWLRQLLKQAA